MLRLLLDAHITPAVAREVQRHRPDCEIAALRDWENGAYLDEPDDGKILGRAHELGYTVLTRDQRTIYPLLVVWEEEDRSHGGVIFVDDQTIPEKDVGGLVRGIIDIWDQERDIEWERRVVYLRRSPRR